MMTRRKTSSTVRASDYGTNELAKRFTVVPKLTLSSGYMGKVVDDSEPDRLLLTDVISSSEYSLLIALLQRLHKATFVGLKSPDFNGIAHSDPSLIGDRKAKAVRSIIRVMGAMDKAMGRANRAALVNLVLLDTPWPYDLACLHRCVDALESLLTTAPSSRQGVRYSTASPIRPSHHPAKAVGR